MNPVMRALLLSDIHGNLEALQAVLAAAPEHDALWNLGDVVGYGASPNETVQCMRLLADVTVRGNHDRVCSGTASAQGFNPMAKRAVRWTAEALTAEARQWLQGLPEGPLVPAGSSSSLTHGSPVHEDHYILNIQDAWEPLQRATQRTTFFGHTHVQGGFQLLGRRWLEVQPVFASAAGSVQWTLKLQDDGTRYLLNPGSVGQPRDDDWRAAFAVLDDAANEVTFYRVPYDLALAQGKILLAGLPERLAVRLREGR